MRIILHNQHLLLITDYSDAVLSSREIGLLSREQSLQFEISCLPLI